MAALRSCRWRCLLRSSRSRSMLLRGVRNAARGKGSAMDQVLEQRPAPEAIPEIEATLNYFVNDGTKIFTEAAGAGERDKRGGTIDPHTVAIRNGRLHCAPFELERHGFHFLRHDTKVVDFFDEAEVRRVYYREMEGLVKAQSG